MHRCPAVPFSLHSDSGRILCHQEKVHGTSEVLCEFVNCLTTVLLVLHAYALLLTLLFAQ